MASDSLESLHDLFVHELRDLYSAETQLIKALPQMARAAESPELRQAFETHLGETREQIRRLEQVFKGLGEKPSGMTCKAMKGLVEEGNELLEEDADPNVMDAALIVAAQKIEHYEIASYGSVCTFGRILGYEEATEILKRTMAEEERTDKLLTNIAQELNIAAETGAETSAGRSGKSGDDDRSDSNAPGRQLSGANRLGSGASRRNTSGGSGRSRSSSRSKSSSSRKSAASRSRRTARSQR